MENSFPIYRAAKPGLVDTFCKYRKTRRPPVNVPYVVDNLWEWVRPEGYPNRRYSAYASPAGEIALKLVGNDTRPYLVEFNGNYLLCQVKDHEDSKDHTECKQIRKLLLDKIGILWASENLQTKESIGRLFIPCLTKEDVDKIFQENDLLRKYKDDLRQAIKYWDNVYLINPGEEIPDPVGEIFFEAFDGYYLREL